MLLTLAEIRSLAEDTLSTTGYPQDEAAAIADHLVDCELRGLSYGGLARALSIVERIKKTKTPRRPIVTVKETPVSAAIDGGDQSGYLVGQYSTTLAIAKAKSMGVAVVGAHNGWYTGMYSYYLEQVTKQGFMGMICGSASPVVAPYGASEARFGTNPIAIGIPTESTPVIWDIGTAGLMNGEIALAARIGALLEPGLAFDKHGNPTRDPVAAANGGCTAAWGAHKGSGLALMLQLMGMMSGAAAAPPLQHDSGFFMVVINPSLISTSPNDDFISKAQAYADSVRDARPIDPQKPIRVPFERSNLQREKNLEEGKIEVADNVYKSIKELLAAGKPTLPYFEADRN